MSADPGSEIKNEVDNAVNIPADIPNGTVFGKEHSELLNDITMDLTVEIGRTKIKISELLNLTQGAVIPLEQRADEPLNIYANDKLIAKGHIICSNGKYSIRVL